LNKPWGWTPPYRPYVTPDLTSWEETLKRFVKPKLKTKGKRVIEKFDDKGNLIERIVEEIE
jgi:hypothetical protein